MGVHFRKILEEIEVREVLALKDGLGQKKACEFVEGLNGLFIWKGRERRMFVLDGVFLKEFLLRWT